MFSQKKRSVDAAGDADALSVNSDAVRLPLPEGIDDVADFASEAGGFSDQASDLQGIEYWDPKDVSSASMQQVGSLSPKDSANLRAMIGNSSFGVKPSLKFKFPWERPGLDKILNKKRKQLIPSPVLPMPSLQPSSSSSGSLPVPVPSDRTRRGIFSEVINFSRDMTQKEVDEKADRQALEKWFLIFSSSTEAWPQGFDLREVVRNRDLEGLKVIFGNKSSSTILRRGSSILAFCKWYRSKFFHLSPFPATRDSVEEYVMDLRRNARPSSAMHGFVEALNFCQHFLGMNIGGGEELITPKILRLIEASDACRPEKKQARVLTVTEVAYLETSLTNEHLSLVDRFACGCMLFCLYTRSRWSDLKKVYGFQCDVMEDSGRISGYIECRTRSHKTARLVARSGLAMPLVAPVWGVTSPPWGLSFMKLCESAGRPLESIDMEPLLTAPSPEGTWTSRSVTTTETGKWLRNILRGLDENLEYTSIHAMKATPLSWCTKWGLDPYVRELLGHHSTGKASAECYGRDNLAKPLRDFETVLQQIRTRSFLPDATRSGMLKQAEVADPSMTFKSSALDDKHVAEDSGEASSESSSDSTHDAEDPADSDQELPENPDPISAPREWDPDTVMYRNKKSKIVHIVAVGGAPSFSCGIQISDDYEEIAESPFLEIRKCRRCAIAKPVKTIGQAASALEKLRLEYEEKRCALP